MADMHEWLESVEHIRLEIDDVLGASMGVSLSY